MDDTYLCQNKRLISGALSGLIEVTTTQPIDFLKTKIQDAVLTNPLHKPKLYDIIKQTIKTNGFIGFYRGYLPRITGVIPMRMTYWGTMSYIDHHIVNINDKLIKSYFVGVIVGSAQTLIDNPIEVLKIRMMTNNRVTFAETLKCLKPRGFIANLARNIQFASMVNLMMNYKNDNPIYNFGICAIGGLLGSLTSQPFDTMKTEKQRFHCDTKTKSYLEMIKFSPKTLWAGGLLRASLGFVNMGIGGMTFIFICDFLS
uniref:Mitochondrial carrier protein n=1 Tax=viral metagenome TaxID=1070528 RepID=A0A6C0EBI5_9ZZZZ